jgi:hypothetical protein
MNILNKNQLCSYQHRAHRNNSTLTALPILRSLRQGSDMMDGILLQWSTSSSSSNWTTATTLVKHHHSFHSLQKRMYRLERPLIHSFQTITCLISSHLTALAAPVSDSANGFTVVSIFCLAGAHWHTPIVHLSVPAWTMPCSPLLSGNGGWWWMDLKGEPRSQP